LGCLARLWGGLFRGGRAPGGVRVRQVWHETWGKRGCPARQGAASPRGGSRGGGGVAGILLGAGAPDEAGWGDLLFAWRICKHVLSNAIVIAKDLQTIGVGAGQMSRVESVRIALDKAREHGHSLAGAALASDAFFPFPDGPELALAAGIGAIVQPGGSKRDADVIAAVTAAGAAMVFTGVDLDHDGKPRKWRVENSWGEKGGDKGFYAMSDPWFDEFNYEIVVHRKYLPEECLKLLDREPVGLEPWDPMGSLA